MEGAHNVSVIPADDLGWMDVGGWSRIFEILEPNEDGNLIEAHTALTIDTGGTLIFQSRDMEEKRLIATLGINDLVIVDTDDVLLLCTRQNAERVRELVNELKRIGLSEYL
jgi:mannose-1-phosphate guanylyltransferase